MDDCWKKHQRDMDDYWKRHQQHERDRAEKLAKSLRKTGYAKDHVSTIPMPEVEIEQIMAPQKVLFRRVWVKGVLHYYACTPEYAEARRKMFDQIDFGSDD